MPDDPLVSVMMPAFNSGATITFALASLVAQTYKNWECIVVDDGSTDNTIEKAGMINDERITIIHREHNSGEAVARQIALDHSRGEFIAMLDADDWLYPEKLERQINVLMENPGLFLVSCGMAIFGKRGEISGIRATGSGVICRFEKVEKLPVAHAPSIFRRTGTLGICYDSKYRMASDSDFLRRALKERTFNVLPYVGYGYRELDSARLRKILAGYYFNARGLAKFFKARPFAIGWQIAKEMAKVLVYLTLAPLGLFGVLIRKRSRPPTESEREDFLRARAVVQAVHDRILAQRGS